MIISTDARRASILSDEQTAIYEPVATRRLSIAVPPSSAGARTVRAAVEILRHGGGLMPRALIGGIFTPSADASLDIEVQVSDQGASANPTCTSQLAKPLTPGLPEEFVAAVVDGLIRRSLSGGRVVVDRAAFDVVESSPLAFELAAELLAVVLAAGSLGNDAASAARDAVEAWP